MELVLKPTYKCNFHCTFCSSNKLPKTEIDFKVLTSKILELKPKTIIVNGGDPLMMPPSFYYDLKSFLLENNLNTEISLTSNLWDWYINPEKWTKCIKDCNLQICTSFQYGGGRLLPNGKPLTDKIFIDLFNKFQQTFDYKLTFISVITNENENLAIKNVELAKFLNTSCKVNGALMSGRQGYLYSREKLFKFYLSLFDSDLYKYEENCKNLINVFTKGQSICPIPSIPCNQNIRILSSNGRFGNCPSLEDDGILDSTVYHFFKKECLGCKFFKLCNSCKKIIHDLQIENNQLLDCSNLKSVFEKLKEKINGL